MYWIATRSVIDPDHNEPAILRRSTNQLMRLPVGKLCLDSTGIAQHLLDLRNRNVSLGMVGAEMPAIRGIPDDRPVVHPLSIYEMGGQVGVASGT